MQPDVSNSGQREDPAFQSQISKSGSDDGIASSGKAVLLAALKFLSIIGKSVSQLLSKTTSTFTGIFANVFKSKPMSMKRCEAGHYFDPAKSAACPLCHPNAESAPGAVQRAVPNHKTGKEKDTVGFMVREQGMDPTVGWVVCVSGPEKGKDYRIRSERNLIGRSSSMQVSIQDESISRDNHASIIYNPHKATFKLQTGESRGMVYLNGEELLQPTEIKTGDKIKIGSSELMFVQFAGSFFDWK